METASTGLPQDEDSLSARVSAGRIGTGNFVFNFPLARVRLLAQAPATARHCPRLLPPLPGRQTRLTSSSRTGQGPIAGARRAPFGHKIPLLGVQTDQNGNLEYVTIPCFATPRVNLGTPADMNQQTDPPNAHPINTIANTEVDTYFGCWLDVNQTGGVNNFLTNPADQRVSVGRPVDWHRIH